MTDNPAWRAAESAARESYGKLVALLAARSRDVASAEDALAEAFAAALEQWPKTGVPRSPDAWLLTTARRRLVDAERRQRSTDRAHAQAALLGAGDSPEIPDYRLALMFACTHPAIDEASRAPLILQVVLGFTAERIGAALLLSPAAVGQRLVRAKRKIKDAGIAVHVPDDAVRAERLDAVLESIYVTYAAGWATPHDIDLTAEAIHLGRMVAALAERDAEPLGLLALMLHAEARRRARRTDAGAFVPLSEQDPARWDVALMIEAEQVLGRASRLGAVGRFQLEAAIQSVHAARRRTGVTDWTAILLLYDALLARGGSIVVAANRAVALAEVAGPAAGLAALDALDGDARMATYQPYWAARAELSARAGRMEAAHDAYQRAIGLATDPAVREYLRSRALCSDRV
jgi:RNA polymerase sigma-70 factor (ECF subfamily)